MTKKSPKPNSIQYNSKNSRYLSPKYKELAKKAFEQEKRIQNYYDFQSKIYDATRWSFLFGRKSIIQNLPFSEHIPFSLLEVGCGTGYNLAKISTQYPKAKLYGVDVSRQMIALTKKKFNKQSKSIQLINCPYNEKTLRHLPAPPKVILFSYALTMINPQWKSLVLQAKKDLPNNGFIAVVDFHNSPLNWFKNHMSQHHVKMEGHILPFLKNHFETVHENIQSAYGGVWKYFSFIGRL
jgi:S-adenosylmethionine-diacylgycerolhomoserine-N-methlytransferase